VADVEVRGAEKLTELGRAMKTADKAMQREVRAALREAVKPAIAAARLRARQTLPHSGGLGQYIGRSRINTQIKMGSQVASLRVTSKSHNPRIDRGVVRHPVFGHRDRWSEQRVPEGWFSQPMTQLGPELRRELLQSMDRLAEQMRKAAR
jgi:hypothetical protein